MNLFARFIIYISVLKVIVEITLMTTKQFPLVSFPVVVT
jgi:hypothetical protein